MDMFEFLSVLPGYSKDKEEEGGGGGVGGRREGKVEGGGDQSGGTMRWAEEVIKGVDRRTDGGVKEHNGGKNEVMQVALSPRHSP